jgi:SHS2 domain-containing protein
MKRSAETDVGSLSIKPSPTTAISGFEYLDHTADIQLHSWGPTLREAFELNAVAMFNYITELDHVSEVDEVEIRAEGHDLPSLLYSFMDELLFQFNGDYFVCKRVQIVSFERDTAWAIVAKGYGEVYDKSKHTPGTEVKAVTYSAMQIHETPERSDVFVIVDI